MRGWTTERTRQSRGSQGGVRGTPGPELLFEVMFNTSCWGVNQLRDTKQQQGDEEGLQSDGNSATKGCEGQQRGEKWPRRDAKISTDANRLYK